MPRVSIPYAAHRERELVRSDRRWLFVVVAAFVGSVGLLYGAYRIYKATGPHPEVTLFIRRAKYVAHWFLPDLRPGSDF